MKKIIILNLVLLLFIGCNKNISNQNPDIQNAEIKIKQLKGFGKGILKLDISNIEKEGDQNNYAGFQTQDLLLSGRLDSKTFFFQNYNYGINKEDRIFKGDDRVIVNKCKDLMQSLNIDSEQILEEEVFSEKIKEAYKEDNGNIKLLDLQDGRKSAFITRKVENFPVFSSYCKLELTSELNVGYLEFHWPHINEKIISQANKLSKIVESNWKAPNVTNARPEKIQVGIVHSSAAGFLMEKKAVIKVIYSSTAEGIGRKPVLYYNENGDQISLPRDFDLETEIEVDRRGN